MIEVEIIGGPEDGKRIALPDGTWELRMAQPMNYAAFMDEELSASRDPCYREVRMNINLTAAGWRAFWREPC